ncbi:hypothetical protein BHU72_10395 [Desulfuribacillus stibiiarsenatis]|uniref:NADP-dependent oxidoreductase domain-containing protein n=1 Tax=Desulfuribacillus stibiiarsenatis TaxID=1390249 RepID=A0A1E5L944_9FIRM|nr:aldo/keto reductase [Desulfuribacillus stibiiarsenatis]OEH86651.1 hypothetical protein BHU72_10395 [Desulfuribacillus stibiiarsenatis]
MRYKTFGSTGLKASQVGVGTLQFPKLTPKEAADTLSYAIEQGINYIDTAKTYGDSETKIAPVIQGRRDQMIISTKTNKRDYQQAKNEIVDSLKKLNTDYLDIVHVHYVNRDEEFTQVMSEQGAMKAILEMKEAGYVRYIAISGHRPDKLAEWVTQFPFDSVLFHLNICQPFAATDIIPVAKGLNIGTVAMRPLAGGFIQPQHLRYLLTQPVDVIIPGFMNRHEIDENLKILSEPVLQEEADYLLQMAQRAGQHGCRRCNACECPKGIKITDAIIPMYYLGNLQPPYNQGNELWRSRQGKVSTCNDCDDCQEQPICESVCPYGVDISKTIRSI